MNETLFELADNALSFTNSIPRLCLVNTLLASSDKANPTFSAASCEKVIMIDKDFESIIVSEIGENEKYMLPLSKERNVQVQALYRKYDTDKLDKLIKRYAGLLRNKEEKTFFKLADSVEVIDNSFEIYCENLCESIINTRFREIEQWDGVVHRIVMNPARLLEVDRLSKKSVVDFIHNFNMKETLNAKHFTGLVGHIWTADLLISNNCPLDSIYMMSSSENVGVYCQKVNRSSYKLGMAISNASMIRKLTVPFEEHSYSRDL